METSASTKERREMTTEALSLSMRDFAAQKWPRLNHKGRIAHLSRALPTWSPRRVRAVYNAESGVSPRANEAADIDELTATDEANRNDYEALQARVARLEAALLATDEEFHQPQVAALREASHDGRRGHVPGDPHPDAE